METGYGVSWGGHWYYLNDSGQWKQAGYPVGGHWYYLNTNRNNQWKQAGYLSGGHWYCLNTDGNNETGYGVLVGSDCYY